MRKIILVLLIFFCAATSGFAQTFDTLLNNLKIYDRLYDQEKVHLHFDKPIYALGDTIWFESYVVNARNNTPSYHSNRIFIQLINSNDSVCKTMQLPVTAGVAKGDITLSDSLQAGVYRICAYTSWMRNFSADYFFTKSINIANPFAGADKDEKSSMAANKVAKPVSAKAVKPGYDIQFFPEGGELVNGIRSTVAFKAVASSGFGANVSGTLVDSRNAPVLQFNTSHAGMGSFNLRPAAGEQYTAVVKLGDGSTERVPLPEVKQSGYVITADNSNPDSLTITMYCTPDLVNKQEMVLMPLSNGVPLFFFKNNFPDTRVNVTAPRNKLPGGILQWTLFGSNNMPVAERLVFNNYQQKINLNIPQTAKLYQKRDKAVLDLQAVDADGNPLIGNFSMAITNADNVQWNEQNETTIFSNLLLTSDLKGYIENPNYYFIDSDQTKQQQLDNLLLTQGYRRFVWKDIETKNFPQINVDPLNDGYLVTGRVVDRKKQPVAGAQVNLLPQEIDMGGIKTALTDQNGAFAFRVAEEKPNAQFMLQVQQKRAQGLQVVLDGNGAPVIEKLPSLYKDTSLTNRERIDTYTHAAAQQLTTSGKASIFKNATLLKEVKINDFGFTHKMPYKSHSRNLNGPGNADHVVTSKDVEKCPDLTCLTSLMPIQVMGDHKEMRLQSRGRSVLVIIDGNRGDNLANVNPQDVESIELLSSLAYTSIYGIAAGSGSVLIVTTKQGGQDPATITQETNITPLKLPVYVAREFYSPRYDSPQQLNKGLDLRTTVYWNPQITTDANGKATVQYYNNDVAGNYRVVVEGISTKGDLCRQVYSYKVE